MREAWGEASALGFHAVLQAAKVGQILIEMKAVTPHGEFLTNATRVLDLLNEKAGSVTVVLVSATVGTTEKNNDCISD